VTAEDDEVGKNYLKKLRELIISKNPTLDGVAGFRLECPKGHRIDQLHMVTDLDGPGANRAYMIIYCPQCPTYRGEYRLLPLMEKVTDCMAAGHHAYRLPS
jgi:hypothetical protein